MLSEQALKALLNGKLIKKDIHWEWGNLRFSVLHIKMLEKLQPRKQGFTCIKFACSSFYAIQGNRSAKLPFLRFYEGNNVPAFKTREAKCFGILLN